MHGGSLTKVQQRPSNKVEVRVGFKVRIEFREKAQSTCWSGCAKAIPGNEVGYKKISTLITF